MALTVKELTETIKKAIEKNASSTFGNIHVTKHGDMNVGNTTGTAWLVHTESKSLRGDNGKEVSHRLAYVVVKHPRARAKKTKLKRNKTLLVIGSKPSNPVMESSPNASPISVSTRQIFEAMSSVTEISAIVFVNLQANCLDTTSRSNSAEAFLILPITRAIAKAIKPSHILPAWGGQALPISAGALLAGLGADISRKKKWQPSWWETTPESVDSPARPSSAFRPGVGIQPLHELNAIFN